jgi:hypothetical protein
VFPAEKAARALVDLDAVDDGRQPSCAYGRVGYLQTLSYQLADRVTASSVTSALDFTSPIARASASRGRSRS